MSARTRIAGWVAAAALGIFMLLTVVPFGGLVSGLTPVLDTDLGHLLWPWQWLSPDPRLILIAPLLVAGLALWRRPPLLAAAALLPVLVEWCQFLVPSLGQVAAARDVAHAWIGLGTGVVLAGAAHLLLLALRWVLTTRRRPVRVLLPASAAALALLVGSVAWPSGETVAVAEEVEPQGPLLGEDFHPGTSPSPDVAAWIEDGLVPGEGGAHEDMARDALWDLRLLTQGLGSGTLPPAGPAPKWDYLWPRDGAFVAVALARTGHGDDAALLLDRLSTLYLDPLYGFDARYLLDGDRVVQDPRGAQVDGCGWVLWAIAQTREHTRLTAAVDGLRDRCLDQVLRATSGGTRLPAASPDYWERATFDRLLGASAPLALGLREAAADLMVSGEIDRAEGVAEAAAAFREQVGTHFGPEFERTARGGGLDASAAMLMPPFDPEPLTGVRDAWKGYQQGAARPGGGLAPGVAWKPDGVSWTPEVALVAYTAAADGQDDVAEHWLDWLDAHRAPWGSLPEKVGPDGQPGGPAPLGWTSALVLLTLGELDAQ